MRKSCSCYEKREVESWSAKNKRKKKWEILLSCATPYSPAFPTAGLLGTRLGNASKSSGKCAREDEREGGGCDSGRQQQVAYGQLSTNQSPPSFSFSTIFSFIFIYFFHFHLCWPPSLFLTIYLKLPWRHVPSSFLFLRYPICTLHLIHSTVWAYTRSPGINPSERICAAAAVHIVSLSLYTLYYYSGQSLGKKKIFAVFKRSYRASEDEGSTRLNLFASVRSVRLDLDRLTALPIHSLHSIYQYIVAATTGYIVYPSSVCHLSVCVAFSRESGGPWILFLLSSKAAQQSGHNSWKKEFVLTERECLFQGLYRSLRRGPTQKQKQHT